MIKAGKKTSKGDPLNFPNPSRSYDEARQGVRFWGYNQTMEISFFVEGGALAKFSPETKTDESALLIAFDLNRDRIFAVAREIYTRRHKASYLFSYTLKDSDF